MTITGFGVTYLISATIVGLIVLVVDLNKYNEISDLIVEVLFAVGIVLVVTFVEYLLYKISETFLTYLMLAILALALCYVVAIKVTGIPYNQLFFRIISLVPDIPLLNIR